MPAISITVNESEKTKLDREAEFEQCSASALAHKALKEYLNRKEWLRRLVLEAEHEAKNGALISGEAIDAWMDSWETDEELPEPRPDISIANQ